MFTKNTVHNFYLYIIQYKTFYCVLNFKIKTYFLLCVNILSHLNWHKIKKEFFFCIIHNQHHNIHQQHHNTVYFSYTCRKTIRIWSGLQRFTLVTEMTLVYRDHLGYKDDLGYRDDLGLQRWPWLQIWPWFTEMTLVTEITLVTDMTLVYRDDLGYRNDLGYRDHLGCRDHLGYRDGLWPYPNQIFCLLDQLNIKYLVYMRFCFFL